MKTRIAAATATLMALATPAFAAERTDHSGIVVWGFLGICAFIIVAQLLPYVLGLFSGGKKH